MNKRQKEAEFAKLRDEKKVLQALKKQYEEAAKDVQGKIHIHDNKIDIMLTEWDEIDDEKRSILQSQIYQKKFQQQLKAQIDETVKKLNAGQYGSIEEYLKDSYTTGAVGNAYDLHGQDVPLVIPIDKKAMLKSVELDPKLSNKLYGSYMEQMKDNIRAEISRGIATADSFEHIARNISNRTNQSFNKTMRIVRTEGHRIQTEAAFEQQKKAKAAGADIVKQWDSTLDGRTRPSHRKLDGQIREIDDYFEVNGHKAKYPSGFGRPEEDINCRCALLQRAKWALDEEELNTLKKRAEYFGLDKVDDFNDFKKKYLKAAEETNEAEYQASIKARRAAYKARQTAKQNTAVVNRFGKEIEFDAKMLEQDRWVTSVSMIRRLSSEYDTRLEKVAFGAKERKAAGIVDITGSTMKLSSSDVATAIHEFAHTLAVEAATKYNIADDGEFWKELKKVNRKYRKAVEGKPELWISSYEHGSRDINEFLAEVFTQVKMAEMGLEMPAKYGTDLTYSKEAMAVIDKYFKKASAEKVVEKSTKSSTIIAGAVSGARNPFSPEAEEHAKRYYGLVRSMKTDVAKISVATGIPEKDVQAVKDFLFYEKHDLGGSEPQLFEPDFMMAESWQRLVDGRPEPHDLTLLRHEIMEKELMAGGMSQDEAHILTSAKFNYDKEARAYHAEIEKHKKK